MRVDSERAIICCYCFLKAIEAVQGGAAGSHRIRTIRPQRERPVVARERLSKSPQLLECLAPIVVGARMGRD